MRIDRNRLGSLGKTPGRVSLEKLQAKFFTAQKATIAHYSYTWAASRLSHRLSRAFATLLITCSSRQFNNT